MSCASSSFTRSVIGLVIHSGVLVFAAIHPSSCFKRRRGCFGNPGGRVEEERTRTILRSAVRDQLKDRVREYVRHVHRPLDLLVLVEVAERPGKPFVRLRDANAVLVEVRGVVEDLLLVVRHHRLEKEHAFLDVRSLCRRTLHIPRSRRTMPPFGTSHATAAPQWQSDA